jgi:hypothetical protein
MLTKPAAPKQQPSMQPTRAPGFGQGSPFAQQSGNFVDHQSPAVNKSSLLSGLTQAGNYKANTGTKTGNQAVSDYAKGMAFQNTANAARSISRQNSENSQQRQQINEQLFEASRSNQLARYKQSVQQSMSSADLANQIAMWRDDMSYNWRNFAMGLLS